MQLRTVLCRDCSHHCREVTTNMLATTPCAASASCPLVITHDVLRTHPPACQAGQRGHHGHKLRWQGLPRKLRRQTVEDAVFSMSDTEKQYKFEMGIVTRHKRPLKQNEEEFLSRALRVKHETSISEYLVREWGPHLELGVGLKKRERAFV